MSHLSCPGYGTAPFASLVADYPGEDVYPAKDFRIEWGPVFHRGRLDTTAKVLVLGQDPATHETVARRILIGEAGQRVQGLLAKVGIDTSYVMVNTFLYSVYGQGGGNRHAKDAHIAEYRHRWLDALLIGSAVTAVVTLGALAKSAFEQWAKLRPDAAHGLHLAAVRHPTYPESAAASGSISLGDATAKLLADWNAHLDGLASHIAPDRPPHTTPYADRWQPGDLAMIPEADLPAGAPPWWRALDAWATRSGKDAQAKRATITITVPKSARSWPPLD